MKLSQVKVIENSGDGQYVIQVPQPHSAFIRYRAQISPKFGLCKVVAIGKNNSNDDAGAAAIQQFDDLFTSLSTKYGTAKKFDFLDAGSIWGDPQHWLLAVFRNQRHLASYWNTPSGSTLPPDISIIGLEARASAIHTYVVLSYEFSNFKECKGEMTAAGDGAL